MSGDDADDRAGAVTRGFHEATEHRPGRTAGGGPFDPRIEPTKVKRYPGLESRPLPDDWDEPVVAAAGVLSEAAPTDPMDPADPVVPASLDLRQVARLLFLSHGVTRRMWGRHLRAAPSAGALYPIEVYLVCGALPGLPAGVYHHDPVRRELVVLRTGDHRGVLAAATAAPDVADRPVSLVLTGIPWRTTWKYGPRGYRHLHWDAGVILANTLAAARSAGLPAAVRTGFVDRAAGSLVDLGDHVPFEEWPLAVASVGAPADAGAAAGHAADRSRTVPGQPRHDVEPLSADLVEWPEVATLHGAGDLTDASAVRAWRRRLDGADTRPTPAQLQPPRTDGSSVDEVILARGSTRRFDPSAGAPEAALAWGVPACLRPVDGDAFPGGGTVLTAALAVHAVEGVDPGGYLWTPDGPSRRVDRQRRRISAHLCLDQDLGGTSALTAFLCADLDDLLEAAGDRGYRVAQLTAGIAAGRLQLGAFALGLGGTGLTFHDDEVRSHFSLDTDPMMTVAIGTPDYEPRPGRRPEPRGEG